MISMIEQIAVGNALRVFLLPPAGAQTWRLLRNVVDSFVDENDPAATVVYDGDDKVIVDTKCLINETPYFYKPFYFDGTVYTPAASVIGTPVSSYSDLTPDVLTVVRERIELGLRNEVKLGRLRHQRGAIPVLTAPPVFEDTVFPIVTVHLQNDSPAERALGEQITGDTFDAASGWTETEGFLADVQLLIMGWSLNADERIALRKAKRRIVIANFPIFDSYGFVEPSMSMQDTEDFGSYNAAVYQCVANFTCVAPELVGSTVDAITDVISTLDI